MSNERYLTAFVLNVFFLFVDQDPNTRTKTVNKLTASKKWTVSALKTCCGLLGVEKSGSRDDVIGRLVDFLLSPSELKSVPDKTKKTKKRKKVSSS